MEPQLTPFNTIDYSDLKPLDKLRREFDPNFLERLGVTNLRGFIKKAYDDKMNESNYKLFARITAKLFYIKACVNCLRDYDPVAARAKAYLATIGYDMYVTAIRFKLAEQGIQGATNEVRENEPAQENEERGKKPMIAQFFRTMLTKISKVPLNTKIDKVRAQKSQYIGTMLTLLNKLGKVQEESKFVLRNDQRVTIDDFITEAFRFVGTADVDQELSATAKLAYFAEHVIFPFAVLCNDEAKRFYTSFRSMPFSVKFFRRSSNVVEQFNSIAGAVSKNKFHNLSIYNAQSWIEDLFGIVISYQMSLTDGKERKLDLRTFRVAYASRVNGFETSDKFYRDADHKVKRASPFIELQFLFKFVDESIFDCFDPEKVNEENIHNLLQAIGEGKGLALSTNELELLGERQFSDDTVRNAISFEQLFGKNLYLKSIR